MFLVLKEVQRFWEGSTDWSSRTDSLLGAVDELVLVGPLEAGLHTFVIPELLHVIEEFLKFEKVTDKKTHVLPSSES